MQSRIAGYLGDVWMGVVCALCVVCVLACLVLLAKLLLQTFFAPSFKRKNPNHDGSAFSMFTLLGLATACLVLPLFLGIGLLSPYYQFFGSMIGLHHITYLADKQFFFSSLDFLLDFRVQFIFWLGLACFVIGYFVFSKKKWSGKFFTLVSIGIVLFGGLCQFGKTIVNTKHVGWKTPTVLLVNPLENLVLQMFQESRGPAYAERDFVTFGNPFPQNVKMGQDGKSSWQKDLKYRLEAFPKEAQTEFGRQLKSNLAARIQQKKPTFLFVIMLESLRPLESAVFVENASKSQLPFMDSLALSGVRYLKSYTSGGVTRAGQEAALCGILVGEKTSAMREQIHLNPSCLPELLKRRFGDDFWSAWWHGGEFNFDGQGSFWKKHGFDHVSSSIDFKQNMAKTFWGFSDRALFGLVKDFFRETTWNQKKGSGSAFMQLHYVLTVTNHPGWSVPKDAPEPSDKTTTDGLSNETQSLQKVRSTFPHWLTSRYTDESLRDFVLTLKKQTCLSCDIGNSIWDQSLVILINDHGSLMPSFKSPEGYAWGGLKSSRIEAAEAMSHAALVLHGGIIEKTLKELSLNSLADNELRSQQDIYATVTDLLQVEGAESSGDSLFAERRRWPVVVDLGERVYFPNSRDADSVLIDRNELRMDSGEASHSVMMFHALQALHQAGLSGQSRKDAQQRFSETSNK